MDQTTLIHRRHSYVLGENATKLNTIDIWLPRATAQASPTNAIWIVYIHGGAWRDPYQDAMKFEPTVPLLSKAQTTRPIAGYASINYRLSPHPRHPDLPSSPDDPSRNAVHPDHINDVSRALIFLDQKYHIDGNYLLSGHSAGGTLTYQVPLTLDGLKLPVPLVALGIAGIYDLPGLLEAHQDNGMYREFVEGAFGPEKDKWTAASPYYSQDPRVWQLAKAVVICHSKDDQLVEERQADVMVGRLQQTPGIRERFSFFPGWGNHGDLEDAQQLSQIILKALALL